MFTIKFFLINNFSTNEKFNASKDRELIFCLKLWFSNVLFINNVIK